MNQTSNKGSYEQLFTKWRNYCWNLQSLGNKVSIGSGRFVNRVPDLNNILTRLDNNLKFPLGDFICEECDNKTSDDF